MNWRWVFSALLLLAGAGFIALGNWQLDRLDWKVALIDRVESRVHADAAPAPLPAEWPDIRVDSHEYRHIFLKGTFLQNRDTRVLAVSEEGSGYWVMTPLQTAERGTVLINRGFVGQGTEPATPPSGTVTLRGLLRLSEPKGGFLRENLPAANRWYSRDVAAIGEYHGVKLAPYFVDAAADQPGSPGGDGPIGGLTVIQFSNTHRVYALTWYTLALMAAGAAFFVLKSRRSQP
ncbi:surfeit locus 1 family protein [Litorivivens lipolytica]|uniref:SURF1-like protein n=1 Tax=Litorivivens lipolytica TaxID=1524264 RepID=A0A7W4Z4P8_9GAMM|nr:SURF1 family protein [Litorivivens lipolytica]MBB3046338.1 surfeit locus 1 family protein [Litorivivens lipolytica]